MLVQMLSEEVLPETCLGCWMTQKNDSVASGEPSIKEGAQGAENVGESAGP